MKKKDLQTLAHMQDDEIDCCRVLEKRDGYIRFAVDEGLPSPEYKLAEQDSERIVSNILSEEQIDPSLQPVLACSFANSKAHYIGTDVVFQTFITCFASHRPLVLSPDIIWLLIAQTIAKHMDNNSEQFRGKLVDFEGQMDLTV